MTKVTIIFKCITETRIVPIPILTSTWNPRKCILCYLNFQTAKNPHRKCRRIQGCQSVVKLSNGVASNSTNQWQIHEVQHVHEMLAILKKEENQLISSIAKVDKIIVDEKRPQTVGAYSGHHDNRIVSIS